MTDKSSISRLRKWIGRAIWNDEGYYRAPSNADAHQWHKKARQAEREFATLVTDNANLREALEGAMGNTILLIEYAEPVYAKHAKYALTSIAHVLKKTVPKETT